MAERPFRQLARAHDAPAVRAWAFARGIELARTGGLPRWVYDLYEQDAQTSASRGPSSSVEMVSTASRTASAATPARGQT